MFLQFLNAQTHTHTHAHLKTDLYKHANTNTNTNANVNTETHTRDIHIHVCMTHTHGYTCIHKHTVYFVKKDIARGGIRLVISRSRTEYEKNVASAFIENYGLAHTQFKKNKDIPEGGSKGVVLLNYNQSGQGVIAFQKYIDSLIDLFVSNDDVLDHYKKPEVIFFGPDENTANLMDWACLRGKQRGYRFWKAITTGKSLSLGGIPHDTYGMTTRGVREYVKGKLIFLFFILGFVLLCFVFCVVCGCVCIE